MPDFKSQVNTWTPLHKDLISKAKFWKLAPEWKEALLVLWCSTDREGYLDSVERIQMNCVGSVFSERFGVGTIIPSESIQGWIDYFLKLAQEDPNQCWFDEQEDGSIRAHDWEDWQVGPSKGQPSQTAGAIRSRRYRGKHAKEIKLARTITQTVIEEIRNAEEQAPPKKSPQVVRDEWDDVPDFSSNGTGTVTRNTPESVTRNATDIKERENKYPPTPLANDNVLQFPQRKPALPAERVVPVETPEKLVVNGFPLQRQSTLSSGGAAATAAAVSTVSESPQEESEFQDWMERAWERHPKKTHKVLAEHALLQTFRGKPELRKLFDANHEIWRKHWEKDDNKFVPALARMNDGLLCGFLVDETWKSLPPGFKPEAAKPKSRYREL